MLSAASGQSFNPVEVFAESTLVMKEPQNFSKEGLLSSGERR
jgi:hypothetical protein